MAIVSTGSRCRRLTAAVMKHCKKKPQRCQGPCSKLVLPSRCVKVTRRGLAGSFVGNDFVGDLLAFLQIAQSRLFHGADVDEHVLAAVVWLYEAVSFVRIKPLHGSRSHRGYP